MRPWNGARLHRLAPYSRGGANDENETCCRRIALGHAAGHTRDGAGSDAGTGRDGIQLSQYGVPEGRLWPPFHAEAARLLCWPHVSGTWSSDGVVWLCGGTVWVL